MLPLVLGWRNIWRNPKRSLIDVAAVASALVFLVLLLGLSEGMKQQLLDNGTGLLSGHLQIHRRDYLPGRSLYHTLGGREGIDPALLASLETLPDVSSISARVYGFALLSTGDQSAGAQLLGVHPDAERRVTTFLSPDLRLSAEPAGQIVLGQGLARELKAQVGSEVAALTQAADGSLGNALFEVSGILRLGIPDLDRSLAVLQVADLQQLLVLDSGRFHELALRLPDPLAASSIARKINRLAILPADSVAQSWEEISPQLHDYLNLFDNFYGFMIGFIALFAALGILNTMMMAVFERTREIGTVSALGMPEGQILGTFLLESLFLSLLGIAVGVVAALLIMQPLATHGLDLSRWTGEVSIMNTRLDPVIHFRWAWRYVIRSAAGLCLASLLAAALPARRAAKMDPIQALNVPGEV